MKHQEDRLIKQLGEQIKSARQQAGISQHELSDRAGLPQSHISKVENAGVDLRVSSLAKLAHALDYELVLVPRRALPLVHSVSRDRVANTRASVESARLVQTIGRLQATQELNLSSSEVAEKIRVRAKDLRYLPLTAAEGQKLHRLRLLLDGHYSSLALESSQSATGEAGNGSGNSTLEIFRRTLKELRLVQRKALIRQSESNEGMQMQLSYTSGDPNG